MKRFNRSTLNKVDCIIMTQRFNGNDEPGKRINLTGVITRIMNKFKRSDGATEV